MSDSLLKLKLNYSGLDTWGSKRYYERALHRWVSRLPDIEDDMLFLKLEDGLLKFNDVIKQSASIESDFVELELDRLEKNLNLNIEGDQFDLSAAKVWKRELEGYKGFLEGKLDSHTKESVNKSQTKYLRDDWQQVSEKIYNQYGEGDSNAETIAMVLISLMDLGYIRKRPGAKALRSILPYFNFIPKSTLDHQIKAYKGNEEPNHRIWAPKDADKEKKLENTKRLISNLLDSN